MLLHLIQGFYIVAGVLFILSLAGLRLGAKVASDESHIPEAECGTAIASGLECVSPSGNTRRRARSA